MVLESEELKTYEIDGKDFRSLEEFYEVFGELALNGYICPNLNAFNDVLRGGFGTPEKGFVVVWKNSNISEKALGLDDYWAIINIFNKHGPNGLDREDNVHLSLQ